MVMVHPLSDWNLSAVPMSYSWQALFLWFSLKLPLQFWTTKAELVAARRRMVERICMVNVEDR